MDCRGWNTVRGVRTKKDGYEEGMEGLRLLLETRTCLWSRIYLILPSSSHQSLVVGVEVGRTTRGYDFAGGGT